MTHNTILTVCPNSPQVGDKFCTILLKIKNKIFQRLDLQKCRSVMPILLAVRFDRYVSRGFRNFKELDLILELFIFSNFLDYCVKSKLIVLNIRYFRFSQFHTTTNTLKIISTHYENIWAFT